MKKKNIIYLCKVSKDDLNYKKYLKQYNWLKNEFSQKNEVTHIKNF